MRLTGAYFPFACEWLHRLHEPLQEISYDSQYAGVVRNSIPSASLERGKGSLVVGWSFKVTNGIWFLC